MTGSSQQLSSDASDGRYHLMTSQFTQRITYLYLANHINAASRVIAIHRRRAPSAASSTISLCIGNMRQGMYISQTRSNNPIRRLRRYGSAYILMLYVIFVRYVHVTVQWSYMHMRSDTAASWACFHAMTRSSAYTYHKLRTQYTYRI